MSEQHSNDPLHGVTLKAIIQDLVDRHGWDELGDRIDIRCFTHDPNLQSTLKFLRKTPWAREKVERLYLDDQRQIQRNAKRNRRRAAMRAHRAEHGTDAAKNEKPESQE